MKRLKLLLPLALVANTDCMGLDSGMQQVNGGPQAPSRSVSSLSCGIPNGWDQLSRLNPRYVIFGEIHGTIEAPGFVGAVACALTKEGKRVLVAVELGAPDNPRLQEAWHSPGNTFETKLLSSGWADRDDGVTSVAMLALLKRLHELKSSGSDISVVAFNGFSDYAQEHRLSSLPGQEPHEAAQAENIKEAANRSVYDYVLILAGVSHARKLEIDHAGEQYRPMAMFLENSGKVVSLRMATSGGTAWNCTLKPGITPQQENSVTSGMVECGNHPFMGLPSPSNLAPLGLGNVPGMDDDPGYDGYFWLGPVSGSAPAVP